MSKNYPGRSVLAARDAARKDAAGPAGTATQRLGAQRLTDLDRYISDVLEYGAKH